MTRSEKIGSVVISRGGGADAYIVGGFAFVRVPHERGRWLRTHPCVAWVRCAFCSSEPGVPCISRRGYGADTHVHRREDYKKWRQTLQAAPDRASTTIHPQDTPEESQHDDPDT